MNLPGFYLCRRTACPPGLDLAYHRTWGKNLVAVLVSLSHGEARMGTTGLLWWVKLAAPAMG